MKKTLLTAAMFICCSAHAQNITTPQIALEAAFDAALIADYQQSSKIDGFCDGRINCTIHETNPLLGDDPGKARLHNYFVTAALAHAAISYVLPDKYRTLWQASSLGVEIGVISRNKHLGLKWNF